MDVTMQVDPHREAGQVSHPMFKVHKTVHDCNENSPDIQLPDEQGTAVFCHVVGAGEVQWPCGGAWRLQLLAPAAARLPC